MHDDVCSMRANPDPAQVFTETGPVRATRAVQTLALGGSGGEIGRWRAALQCVWLRLSSRTNNSVASDYECSKRCPFLCVVGWLRLTGY